MIVSAKDVLWKERIAQWYESGLTQTDYAKQIGVPQRSISYWAYKLRTLQMLPDEVSTPATLRASEVVVSPSAKRDLPALLPVQVGMPLTDVPSEVCALITLSNERGWTLSLSSDVSASWLAELMRGL